MGAYGNAHKYRPEIQARKAMYAASPEHCRRKAMYHKASGLKKEKVRVWNHTWALSGYPDSFPDFDAFWASHPAALEWIAQRKRNQVFNRWSKKKHAAWLAAGQPAGTDGAGKTWHETYNAANPPPVN